MPALTSSPVFPLPAPGNEGGLSPAEERRGKKRSQSISVSQMDSLQNGSGPSAGWRAIGCHVFQLMSLSEPQMCLNACGESRREKNEKVLPLRRTSSISLSMQMEWNECICSHGNSNIIANGRCGDTGAVMADSALSPRVTIWVGQTCARP